jgi:hypothetical protein
MSEACAAAVQQLLLMCCHMHPATTVSVPQASARAAALPRGAFYGLCCCPVLSSKLSSRWQCILQLVLLTQALHWIAVLHPSTAAVRPQATIAACSSGLSDFTFRENISPSYCTNTQSPQLVAEWNVFSAFASTLGTTGTTPVPQLANSITTVALSDGRSFTIDPTLELASGGLDSSDTPRDQIDGKLTRSICVGC